MFEIYASWTKGLPYDNEALKLLADSQLIDGIELGNINNDYKLIADSGLKESAHTPGLYSTINLGKKNYMNIFKENTGNKILNFIRDSDSPVVGFHLGYTAEKIYKMNSFPNIPYFYTIIRDSDFLNDRIIKNVKSLEYKINYNQSSDKQKFILLETLDFSRSVPILWSEQSNEAKSNKEEIDNVISEYGPNAALGNLTDSSEVNFIINEVNKSSILPIGFLFDVAHNYISADAKIHEGLYNGTIEDYFIDMLKVVGNKTMQIHINVPGGDLDTGYNDSHLPFADDDLSIELLNLANLVVNNCPNLRVLTLEIRTPYTPLEHAKIMIEQADLVIKSLKLN